MCRRVAVFGVVLALLMGVVTLRLWSLSTSVPQTVSSAQSSRAEVIASARGTIYDRYMQPLVNRSSVVVASVSPFAPCVQAVRDSGQPVDLQELLENSARGDRTLITLDEVLSDTYGIVQVSCPRRYERDVSTAHIIGYVNGQGQGVCGVEKACDAVLAAYEGSAVIRYRADALGRTAIGSDVSLESTLPNATGGVVLTLDAQIQELSHTAACEYLERGAVLISDAKSGELLASVSVPSYDPNQVEAVLDSQDAPLVDRTLINYNCGSVFKLITVLAALESGVSAERTYECQGACTFGGVIIRCHETDGHGQLTMAQALAQSCNCYFMQLAQEIGAPSICDIAERAGFQSSVSLMEGLSTARAIMPERQDLSASAALANLSIGQGDLLATPHHVQTLMNAIVNGGVYRSTSLYAARVDENGRRVEEVSKSQNKRIFSSKTAQTLQTMLEMAVAEGTGWAARPSALHAAGKTGTAETGWMQGDETVVQSWFCGYYPSESPQYIITVLSENGANSGKTAAPLFKVLCDGLYAQGLVENTA